jgi:hypothetical protein
VDQAGGAVTAVKDKAVEGFETVKEAVEDRLG